MIYSLVLMKNQEPTNAITRACYSKHPLQPCDKQPCEGWEEDGKQQFGHGIMSLSPTKPHRPQEIRWLRAAPHLQQHFCVPASWPGSQQFCVSHYLSCRSTTLSRLAGALLPVIPIPRALWFSANFAYAAVSRISSSVFTRVSQWSLLTTIERDNIIMF